MRGNHDYIFDFLKSVCSAFGHLYGKQEGILPEALMEAVSYTHLPGGLYRAAGHSEQGTLGGRPLSGLGGRRPSDCRCV